MELGFMELQLASRRLIKWVLKKMCHAEEILFPFNINQRIHTTALFLGAYRLIDNAELSRLKWI